MNEKIKKIENLDDKCITYFAKADGFDFNTATEIVNALMKDYQVKTFTVYALLFFGYEHEVLRDDISEMSECLEVFTQYKLSLTEIQLCTLREEVTFLFE